MADTGDGAYYALFSVAAKFAIDPQSIKTAALKSPSAELGALSRGSIDAALLPYATALQDAGKQGSVLRISNFAEWQQGVVFATADATANRRDLIARFMRAYQRGTAAYQINFLHYDDGGDFIPGPRYDDYLALIAREAHVSPAVLAATKTYCDRRGNPDAADIGKQVQFWQDRGRLDKQVTAADLLDLSFIGEETAAGNPSAGR